MGFNLNEYEPVESRLDRFWQQYPNGAVVTDLVFHDENRFIVKASVYTDRANLEGSLLATGYAEERVDPNPKRVNFASAAENCETSSIGRALANANFQTKGQRPSREEMQKVQRAQDSAVVEPPAYVARVRALLQELSPDIATRQKYVVGLVGRDVANLQNLTEEEATNVITDLEFVLANRTTITEEA